MVEPLEKARDDLVDEVVEKQLKSDNYYQSQATDLITAEQLKQRDREEIKASLKDQELAQSIGRGFDLIKQDIIEVLDEEQLVPFFDDMSKINEESLATLPEKAKRLLDSGEEALTYQDLFEIDNETLREIYKLGYQYFEKEVYQNAVDVFTVVTTFNPYIADFWNAMALSYQAMKKWEKAVESFSVACAINAENVAPRVSRAECCIKLDRVCEADKELETASKIIEANPALDEEWGAYLKNLRQNL